MHVYASAYLLSAQLQFQVANQPIFFQQIIVQYLDVKNS